MEILNIEKYEKKVNKLNDKYWNSSFKKRWVYMQSVIDEIKNINPESILEIGAYKINYTDISDNMDISKKNIDIDNLNNKKYIQNASEIPWEIEDKYYDLVIICQVFEHLSPNQFNVFNEIIRISKNVIITIPWKWHKPGNIHHDINEKHLIEWFGEKHKPYIEKLIDNRLMLCYNFSI
ncbi:MAG: class I SAM-dependent methyltransferase [bacterium]